MKFASEKRACSAFRSFSQSVFRETHTYATQRLTQMDTYPEPMLGPRLASWDVAPSHHTHHPHHRSRVMSTSTPSMVAGSGPSGPMAPHVTPLQANRPTCANDQTALRPVPQTAPVQMMPPAPAASQRLRTANPQMPQLSELQRGFLDVLERQRL